MLGLLLTTVILVAITVAIHAVGTTYWMKFLGHRYFGSDGQVKPRLALPAVTWTAVAFLMLHLLEVVVWAAAYRLILPGAHLETFEKAVYFSIVTFTTLGYGDVTLVDHEWRLLSGVEALNGILLVGWTTALLFMVVQRSGASLLGGHRGK